MQGFIRFMENYFVPVAARIGSQRHLIAIRDGFVAMIAITIAGSMAVLINNLPIDAYQEWRGSSELGGWISAVNGTVWWGSFAIISLLVVFAVAQSLWASYGNAGLEGGMIATAVYFIGTPQMMKITPPEGAEFPAWGAISWGHLNSNAIFYALLVAIVSVEFLRILGNVGFLNIKMPSEVPPAVARSFSKLLPGMIVLFVLSFVVVAINKTFAWDGTIGLAGKINEYVGAPIADLTDSPGAAFLIPFLVALLWFFGLHGANILDGIIKAPLLQLGAENQELANQGLRSIEDGFNTIAGPFFNVFVYMGGSGATLGLVIAMLILTFVQRTNRYSAVLAVSGAPGLFNINEPIIFGFPIVLNPIMFLPFLFVMPIMSLVAYFAIDLGLVSPILVQEVPWTAPPIFGGFLATGTISGALLAAVNLVISTVIYFPFLYLQQRQEAKNAAEQSA
ncbi:MAG: PTS sugar transporter subunit IIC [Bacilli bacterium]